jgi:huntingtin-interacting protein 1-related protein
MKAPEVIMKSHGIARAAHKVPSGYGPLIRSYVQFILAKLRFHRLRPEFNGLFEYEEYISLKGIDDPNEGCELSSLLWAPFPEGPCSSYETISDLMGLQDQIDSFQRMIFAHFRNSTNNECRISALVPLVKESWGIYRFITSMLRAMHRSTWLHRGQVVHAIHDKLQRRMTRRHWFL